MTRPRFSQQELITTLKQAQQQPVSLLRLRQSQLRSVNEGLACGATFAIDDGV